MVADEHAAIGYSTSSAYKDKVSQKVRGAVLHEDATLVRPWFHFEDNILQGCGLRDLPVNTICFVLHIRHVYDEIAHLSVEVVLVSVPSGWPIVVVVGVKDANTIESR